MSQPVTTPLHPDPSEAPVVVIGAGPVGLALAGAAAAAGHPVVLADSRPSGAEDAVRDLPAEIHDRVVPYATVDMATLPPATLVVECVVDQADVKRAVLRQLEDGQPVTTVLAVHTRQLDVDDLVGEATAGHDAALHGGTSPALAHPGRVIGITIDPQAGTCAVRPGSQTHGDVVEALSTTLAAWGFAPA